MKSSILRSLVCASILVFAIGCGKENKSGGGNPGGYFDYNQLINSGLNPQNQQALQNVTNWYNGSTEGQWNINRFVNYERRQFEYSAATQSCVQKKFLGIPYQVCSYTSSGSGTGAVIASGTVQLLQDGTAINAKGNQELNAIFSGGNGTLIGALEMGSQYILEFVTSDGKVISYTIDRNYHSLLNPVKKVISTQSSKTEVITSAQVVQSNFP